MADSAAPPLLLTLAPAPAAIGALLRGAIDAEQVGARRLHLAADQPDAGSAVQALREQTSLVLTADPDAPFADLVDRVDLPEVIVDGSVLPEVVERVAQLAARHDAAVSISGRGDAALSVLLAALACGTHVRVGTADGPAAGEPRGPGRDDAALAARAAGLARLAHRRPMTPDEARRALGLE